MDEWRAFHFSQANPGGERQDDVPALLRRVADSIAELGEVQVMDVVFRTERTSEGDSHPMTVYYLRPDTDP